MSDWIELIRWPEVEVKVDYTPAEKQTRWHPGYDEEITLTALRVHGKSVAEDIELFLMDQFNDVFCEDVWEVWRMMDEDSKLAAAGY